MKATLASARQQSEVLSAQRREAEAKLDQAKAALEGATKLSPDNAQSKKDLAWINQQIAELAARQDLSQTPSRNRSPHTERK